MTADPSLKKYQQVSNIVIFFSPASALYSCSLSSQPAIYYVCVCVCLRVCTRCVSEHKHLHNTLQLELTTPWQTVIELIFKKRWQRVACEQHSIIVRPNASMSLPQANTCHSCQLLFVCVLKADKKITKALRAAVIPD